MCHTILTPGCQEGVSGRPEGVRRSLLLSEHVDFVLCKLAKSSEPVRFGHSISWPSCLVAGFFHWQFSYVLIVCLCVTSSPVHGMGENCLYNLVSPPPWQIHELSV